MKMSTGGGYRTLTCNLSVSPQLSLKTSVPCPYEADTIAYAVCRFLRHSTVTSQYVTESYRLRFAKGKARRSVTRWFLAAAAPMGLPEGCVLARVSISPDGVTLEHVSLCPNRNAALRERYIC